MNKEEQLKQELERKRKLGILAPIEFIEIKGFDYYATKFENTKKGDVIILEENPTLAIVESFVNNYQGTYSKRIIMSQDSTSFNTDLTFQIIGTEFCKKVLWTNNKAINNYIHSLLSSPAAGLPTEWPDSKECQQAMEMQWERTNDILTSGVDPADHAIGWGDCINWLRSRLKEGGGRVEMSNIISNPEEFEDEIYTCEICDTELQWEDCYQCGSEGGRDGEELMMEDPMWYSPDDFETCDICYGKGGYFVCPNHKNHTKDNPPATSNKQTK